MDEFRIRVGGMGCRHCVRAVTARLRDVAGVSLVTVDVDDKLVVIAGTMTRKDVEAAMKASIQDVEIMDEPVPG